LRIIFGSITFEHSFKSIENSIGQEAEHKIERHKRRYKEIVDTIHEVGVQIQNIRRTFLATEEAMFKETVVEDLGHIIRAIQISKIFQKVATAPPVQAPIFIQPLKDGQVKVYN